MHKSQLQANFTTRYCGCQGKGSLRPLGCQFFPEIFILRKLIKIRLPTAHDLSALQRIRSFYGVFALCLAVGLFSLFYVRASGAQTNELLERSIRQAETEDYTGAAASLRQAKQVWEGRERILGIFLHHEEVDEVIALFAQLEQFIRLEDLDDYLAACHELTARLEHIRRMELPTVENVM